MSFRAKLLAGFLVVVVAPLVLLIVIIPAEMSKQLRGQYRARVDATAQTVRSSLAGESASIASRLRVVADGLGRENDIRRALVNESADRRLLLEYGEISLLRTGLTMLQVQNDSGRIVTSGHFMGEFDRMAPALPTAVGSVNGGAALVKVRTPTGSMLALARLDTTRVALRLFTLIGGTEVGDRYLRSLGLPPGVAVTLMVPDSTGVAVVASPGTGPNSNGVVSRRDAMDSIPVPYIDATGDSAQVGVAQFVVTHSTAELNALLRDVRLWIVAVIFGAVVAALAVAYWLSSRLSSPLAELASESLKVDLNDPNAHFSSAARDDEIGTLARRLGAMVQRLRAGAVKLRDAERRATVGDIARQVNHDIKNGLTPIRNVVRHLAQVARDSPAELPASFTGRQQTLESSIDYLDTLARNYARLSPRLDAAPCDVRPVIEEVVRAAEGRPGSVKWSVAAETPRVAADAAVLRRILENLVGNAMDALDGKGDGEVAVSAAPAATGAQVPMVRIAVTDTGRGMTEQELQKAFDDFYTTKDGGTGLGLSVVRRLVADVSGILRVETEPGRGTRFTVDIPVAAPQSPGAARAAVPTGAGG